MGSLEEPGRTEQQQLERVDTPVRDVFPVNGMDWGSSWAVGCSWLLPTTSLPAKISRSVDVKLFFHGMYLDFTMYLYHFLTGNVSK